MIQDNLFNYKNFLFLRISVFLVLLSAFAYLFDQPTIVANGGTWLGYTLGSIGALLILWLLYLGVRKRQYTKQAGNLRAWVSAHIYLGIALAVVGTLHAGFQIGWNIHSLAYLLMMATIVSGIWGLVLYVRLPIKMSNTLNHKDPAAIVAEIESLDRDASKMGIRNMPEKIQRALNASNQQLIFNKKRERLTGCVRECKTEQVILLLQDQLGRSESLSNVYKNQVERLRALRQLRRYYCMRHWLNFWLLVHVPLSVGLLAALIAHVVSVFFYW